MDSDSINTNNILTPQDSDSPLVQKIVRWVIDCKQSDPWLVVKREALFWYALWYHPTTGHVYEPITQAKEQVVHFCRDRGLDPIEAYILFLRGEVAPPQPLLERPEAFRDALLFFIEGRCSYWEPSPDLLLTVKELVRQQVIEYYTHCL